MPDNLANQSPDQRRPHLSSAFGPEINTYDNSGAPYSALQYNAARITALAEYQQLHALAGTPEGLIRLEMLLGRHFEGPTAAGRAAAHAIQWHNVRRIQIALDPSRSSVPEEDERALVADFFDVNPHSSWQDLQHAMVSYFATSTLLASALTEDSQPRLTIREALSIQAVSGNASLNPELRDSFKDYWLSILEDIS